MARDRRTPADGETSRLKGRRSANDAEDQCHPRKIFIGGLAHKTKTHHLREHFQRYGAIVDAVVLQWPDGRSRGFGYVTFAETPAALSALELEHQIGGRQVDVKRAVPGTNKLFVGGLPQNASVVELREHFEAFGLVSDAVVMMDPTTNRSRGFGFVCFLPGAEGAKAVAAALEQYNNHRIRGKWIEVKSAAPPHKLAEAGEEAPQGSPEGSPKGSPKGTPRLRPHADASARRPPHAAAGPAKIPHGGLPAPPPGLCSEAGARVPPGLLGAPGGQAAPAWPGATAGFVPYQAPAPCQPPAAAASAAHKDASARDASAREPMKVQAGNWASASMDLQRSLAELLASHCKSENGPHCKSENTEPNTEAFLNSPEKVKTKGVPSVPAAAFGDSYFAEADPGSSVKAER